MAISRATITSPVRSADRSPTLPPRRLARCTGGSRRGRGLRSRTIGWSSMVAARPAGRRRRAGPGPGSHVPVHPTPDKEEAVMAKRPKGTKSEGNLKEAFAGESQANQRYQYFARAADIEGFPDIAGLFKDTADAETG